MPLAANVKLQPHQERLRRDAEEAAAQGRPFRKMVVWSMGSGKSLGSLAAADALGQPFAAIVPAALRKTYEQERDRFLTADSPSSAILSYTDVVRGKRPPPGTRTLVFDEAARITSPGSAQGAAARALAAQVPNVLLLSGTPMRNRPEELAPLLETLTGRPISHEEFQSRYVGEKPVHRGGWLGGILGRLLGWKPIDHEPYVRRPRELRHLLTGKVDYYESPNAPVDVKYEDIEVDMAPRQLQVYQRLWNQVPAIVRWKLSRNYALTDEDIRSVRSFLTGPREAALSTLPFMLRPNPFQAFQESSKLQTAFDRLQGHLGSHPQAKAIIYSNFITAGLRPYAAALERAGVPYAIFDGSLSDVQRKRMVDAFNRGDIRVALVGPAGAEGISLKGAQLLQRLDGHWNESRNRQAEARGLRFDSHANLPEELRRMRVERYISRIPLGLRARLLSEAGIRIPSHQYSIDSYLRDVAHRKQRLVDAFTDVLRDVSPKSAVASDLAWIAASVGYTPPSSPHRRKPRIHDPSVLTDLRRAKDLSDRRQYSMKAKILRRMIRRDPSAWRVDDDTHPYVLGLTHRTGWRFHLPRHRLRDLLALIPGRPPTPGLPKDRLPEDLLPRSDRARLTKHRDPLRPWL